MNVNVLIDNILRKTASLVAELATNGGLRPSLADSGQVFFQSLIEELEARKVPRKVVADMLGLTPRGLQKKLGRLADGSAPNRTLWEGILSYLREHGETPRAQLMNRFSVDSGSVLSSVLRDLEKSGLVTRIGARRTATYKLAPRADLARMLTDDEGAHDELLRFAVYRSGPLSAADLAAQLELTVPEVSDGLSRLVESGKIVGSDEGVPRYAARHCLIAAESPTTWAASVLDHYTAMVDAISLKLSRTPVPEGAPVGGSTYSLDLWPEHPFREDILSLLGTTRTKLDALCARAAEGRSERDEQAESRLTFYFGQGLHSIAEQAEEGGCAS